jgi:hypothetical protein
MAEHYDVGYGKPPKNGQFQKGHTGNPKGRPKGTKNLKTDLLEELNEKVVINEGGQAKKISKQRAFLKGLAVKAINGDPRSMTLLANLALRLFSNDPEPIDDIDLTDGDRMILDKFREEATREALKTLGKGGKNGK